MTVFSSRYRMGGKPGARGPDEVEALQTDVMRFMAILGSCLMVIFALVKTIPMAPPDTRPMIEAPRTSIPISEAPLPQNPPAGTRFTKMEAPAPPAPPPEPARQPEGEDGFVLRFSSERGLQSLVARGEVNVYAMAGNEAWCLEVGTGVPRFVPSDGPFLFYEMAPETVPGPYTRALAVRVAAFGRHPVTWGVTLPERTRAGIHDRMKGKRGGTLVIQEDGRVIHTPARAGRRGQP